MPDLSHLRERESILVTMVCIGNICRSPMAAAVLSAKSKRITKPIINVDSAGSSTWHVGDGPNIQSLNTWERAGYRYEHIASHFTAERLAKSDLILVMERSNYNYVLGLTDDEELIKKVHFLRDFDYTTAGEREVPDPYSLPDSAFEEVLSMVERATDGLIEELTK